MNRFKSIAIIGLGLMGASLAAACRKQFPHARILGISRSPKALREAQKRRWIHEGIQDIRFAAHADLVVLCTPVDIMASLLTCLDRAAARPLLVTDVGSAKEDLEKRISRKHFAHVQFVGAHPMVGSHERGIDAARSNLYDGGFTFIIPSKLRAFKEIKNFWKKISPRVIEIKAQEHDQIVAQISHLPHAVAACLVVAVSKKALPFSASGFRDSTRIAESAPSVWLPIFLANAKWIAKSLKKFEKELAYFRRALECKDPKRLRLFLEQARKVRSQISL